MTKDLKERLQYRINRLFSRGATAQYVAVFLAFVIVTLLGMNAYFVGLFSENSLAAEGIEGNIDRGLLDSLWWSVKHVLDPGQFAEDYGASWPILLIALLLSVAGLALLGILIGLISSLIQQRFDSWKRGNTAVKERDHTLILGWNQNVAGILRYFSETGYRKRIVVLAPYDIQDMEDAIRVSESADSNLDVVLRSGLTSEAQELDRVALGEAGCVISLAHEHSGTGHPDVASIKTLMLLNAHEWENAKPPIAAEVTEKQNVEIADIAGGRQIPIVSSSEVISRIMVQCARHPGLSDLYAELFSPVNNHIVAKAFPDLDGAVFSDVAQQFPDAIPLGVTWSVASSHGSRTACALNVEPDYDLAEDEQLIFLSRHEQPVLDSTIITRDAGENDSPRKTSAKMKRVAVIGWNRNIDEMLQEFDGHAMHGAEVTVVAGQTDEAVFESLNRINDSIHNIKIDYRRGDTVDRPTLIELDPWSYDAILLLADNSYSATDPDSRTIMTALVLSDIQTDTGRPLPHAVIELQDLRNRPLLDGVLEGDIIVSPELVSMQLAQISQQQVLGAIYRELLSAGGMEIALRPASEYAHIGGQVSFADLVLAAQGHAEIALGVRAGDGGFRVNPPKNQIWTLSPEDQVVVLAQQIYD